jgi:hypothetical protein
MSSELASSIIKLPLDAAEARFQVLHAGLGVRHDCHLLVDERHLGAQLRVELAREAGREWEEPPRLARGPHGDARGGAEDVQTVARRHERQAALHQLLRQA